MYVCMRVERGEEGAGLKDCHASFPPAHRATHCSCINLVSYPTGHGTVDVWVPTDIMVMCMDMAT